MTIHVDDLNIAGDPRVVQELLKTLEHEFGELAVQRGTVTNCSVQHVQNPATREITLDQLDFLSNLRTVEHPQLATGTNEEKCAEALRQLYMSLLGPIAYASHTRVDVIVFIVRYRCRITAPKYSMCGDSTNFSDGYIVTQLSCCTGHLLLKSHTFALCLMLLLRRTLTRGIASEERCTCELQVAHLSR